MLAAAAAVAAHHGIEWAQLGADAALTTGLIAFCAPLVRYLFKHAVEDVLDASTERVAGTIDDHGRQLAYLRGVADAQTGKLPPATF